ncbi:amidase family protein [Herbiconiux moechotypicola]|uniref:Amidase family protein n=1 Tax=Herbiconiux moechotypicola TaxID=637393 RepID=A0ABN3DAC6_9MICO|nr:amidase family protein [Herbiconiux moechotypicola]MCS5729009.1 amidase family protein [Herbiconiux moechotypicola]
MTAGDTDRFAWLSATELTAGYAAGGFDPVDVAEETVARIERLDPQINAYIAFEPEQVLAEARALATEAAAGQVRGPLHGVPFSVKGLTDVAGLPQTRGGLRTQLHAVVEHDAVVVRRLREAGGLFLGHTNAPPVGYTAGTRSPLYGQTENPWGAGLTPGGSSGGSAAAVAAGFGPIAEGGDGAGSVRIPASLCGLVGMKPGFGVIPQTIVPSLTGTNVFHGCLTRTVDDNALMLDVVAGDDPADPLSVPAPAGGYRSAVGEGVRGMRIAWSPSLGTGERVDPSVLEACEGAVRALESAGAIVIEASPEWPDDFAAVMWTGIWVPSAAGALPLLDAEQERYGDLPDDLLELMDEARVLRSSEVERARGRLAGLWAEYARFMSSFDVLASPTLASAAFPHSQTVPSWLEGGPASSLLKWLFTYPFNALAQPALSVPAGFTPGGLPVGLQLATTPRRERVLYAAAGALERARPWRMRRPPLAP